MEVLSQVVIPYSWGSVENAEITEWVAQEGADVAAGDVLAEVTTDKVDTELEAPAAGRVVRHLVAPGTEAQVGTPVALLAAPGASDEDVAKALAAFDAGGVELPASGD
jgi:pyruvate/2-oxoglutarate dehydrogenase complex dihydrolipoamide acyltransferase (E2) component